jgi:hypothetical protein
MIAKKELRKKFNRWLGDYFDNRNKKSRGETHRWILCYDGDRECDFFDCACCLTTDEIEKCGCHCHTRITEIVSFFWRALVEGKLPGDDEDKLPGEHEIGEYDAINMMQDDILVLLRVLGLKDCARDISPHEVMVNEIIPTIQTLMLRKGE